MCYPSNKLLPQATASVTSYRQVSTRLGEMHLRQQVEAALPWWLKAPMSLIWPAPC